MKAVEADREIRHLLSLPDSTKGRETLFETRTQIDDSALDKKYYMACQEEVVDSVSESVRSVLSVGCGCGTTEAALVKRGVEVTGIPLDSVVGVTAAAKGIRVTEANLTRAVDALKEERFDCVLLMDVLHHSEDPVGVLRLLLPLMSERGELVARVPNCHHPFMLRRKVLRKVLWSSLFQSESADFRKYGVHLDGARRLTSWLRLAGLRVISRTKGRLRGGDAKSRLGRMFSRWTVARAVRKLAE